MGKISRTINWNMADNGKPGIAKVYTYQQQDTDFHNHDFFELVYVLDGRAHHFLNDLEITLSKNAFFVLDYECYHKYIDCENLVVINCLFLPEFVDDLMKDCRTLDEMLRLTLYKYYTKNQVQSFERRIFHDDDSKILHLLLEMQEEYEQKKAGYQGVMKTNLLKIMILTMRKALEEYKYDSNKMITVSIVTEAVHYLNYNYMQHATIAKFCEIKHYSHQYIGRKFKQEMGMSIMDYLQRVRVEKSCQLLTNENMSIREIAYAVGYDDVKFYNKIFKRLMHVTPREYKKIICSARDTVL